MSRAPFQVLVLPYRIVSGEDIVYAVFKRKPETGGYWQGIAGGGEEGEFPLTTARREAMEEAGIATDSEFLKLDSLSTVPLDGVCGFLWGPDVLVIPEYSFGVRVTTDRLHLSDEHTEYRWLDYHAAHTLLRWDSNKNALWELDKRLRGNQ
ncbi:MAG: NUDIX domain-containing protein [bacterium]